MTTYKCSKCDFERSIKGYVSQHISKNVKCQGAELIENILKVKCEVCGKEFDNESLLKVHRGRCIEKKAFVQKAYVDPETVSQSLNIFTDIIKKHEVRLLQLEEANSMLIKRIEKLEAKKVEAKPEYKKCADNCSCMHSKKVEFVPNNQEHIKQKLREIGMDVDEVNLVMTISGQRSNEVCGNVEDRDFIEIDGVNYYYDKTRKWGKGAKYADELKIVLKKFLCKNDAVYEPEPDLYLCEEHISFYGH